MELSIWSNSIFSVYIPSVYGAGIGIALLATMVVILIKTFIRDKKFLDLIGVLCFIAILAAFIIFAAKDDLCDIPNVIHGNYEQVTGTVIDQETYERESGARQFTIKIDGADEIIKITALHKLLDKGSRVEVVYLPYSKVGAITHVIPMD